MANNVYIGSRYVPIFDGDWDNTKNYEALTIVLYNGSSYTSKKPVPAGTLPTNTTYWALTGNYNGQISNLQSQIDAIDLVVGTIPTLQNQVNTIDGELDAVKVRTGAKKVVVIADSYGMVHPTNFLSILKGALSSVYDGVGISSIGFTPVSPYTFEDQFDTFIANYSADDKAAVSDIVFAGGWNDAREIYNGSQTEASVMNAIVSTAAHCRTVCPNAIIHPCFMAWHSARSAQNQVTLTTLKAAMNAYENAKGAYIEPLTHCKYVMHDSTCMDSSYFHPNESNGAPALANAVHSDLFSGGKNYFNSYNFVVSYLSTNNAFDNSTRFRVTYNDGVTRISSAQVVLNGSGISGGIIGVVNANYFPPLPGGISEVGGGIYVVLHATCSGKVNGVTYTCAPCQIFYYGTTGNLLMIGPSGAAVTDLENVVLWLDSTIDNMNCV
jgi:hypothetical protein